MKKIIMAAIDRIIDFDSSEEAAAYIEKLREKKSIFRIVSREEVNRRCRIRIQEQYNNVPLIEG